MTIIVVVVHVQGRADTVVRSGATPGAEVIRHRVDRVRNRRAGAVEVLGLDPERVGRQIIRRLQHYREGEIVRPGRLRRRAFAPNQRPFVVRTEGITRRLLVGDGCRGPALVDGRRHRGSIQPQHNRTIHHRSQIVAQNDLDGLVGRRSGVSIRRHQRLNISSTTPGPERLHRLRIVLVHQILEARVEVLHEPLQIRSATALPPEQSERIIPGRGDHKVEERGVRSAAAVKRSEDLTERIGRSGRHCHLEPIIAIHAHPVKPRVKLQIRLHLRHEVIDCPPAPSASPRVRAAAWNSGNGHVQHVHRRIIRRSEIPNLLAGSIRIRPGRIHGAVPVDKVHVDRPGLGRRVGYVGVWLARVGINETSRPLLFHVGNRVLVAGVADKIDLIHLHLHSRIRGRRGDGIARRNSRVGSNCEPPCHGLRQR